MTKEEMEALQPGDIVRLITARGSEGYIVTANYLSRVTVVRTHEITNPREWLLIKPGLTLGQSGEH